MATAAIAHGIAHAAHAPQSSAGAHHHGGAGGPRSCASSVGALSELQRLREVGALSDAEFEQAKAAVLRDSFPTAAAVEAAEADAKAEKIRENQLLCYEKKVDECTSLSIVGALIFVSGLAWFSEYDGEMFETKMYAGGSTYAAFIICLCASVSLTGISVSMFTMMYNSVKNAVSEIHSDGEIDDKDLRMLAEFFKSTKRMKMMSRLLLGLGTGFFYSACGVYMYVKIDHAHWFTIGGGIFLLALSVVGTLVVVFSTHRSYMVVKKGVRMAKKRTWRIGQRTGKPNGERGEADPLVTVN